MQKENYPRIIIGMLACGLLVAGCSKSENKAGSEGSKSEKASKRTPYFKTAFYEESQFIVETIVTDIAEQLYYTKNRRVPDAGGLRVSVNETKGGGPGAPVYDVEIILGSGQPAVHSTLPIKGAIWSAEVYRDFTRELAAKVGLESSTASDTEDASLLTSLTDAKADTIEEENKKLSRALEDDFANPVLHEKAAVLVGVFTLREHSGDFLEIRSPLCRITAHLAVARQLRGEKAAGINARVADVLLETLMNNQSAALKKLSQLGEQDDTMAKWSRVLRAYITGDYRPLKELPKRSPIERVAWFSAYAASVDANLAWGELAALEKLYPDFARIVNCQPYSVGTGHELLQYALSSEIKEFGSVYELAIGGKIQPGDLPRILNEMPDRCFKGDGHVRVIGWGLWAGFFQRHLCHAIQHNFEFLEEMLGVRDDAREFAVMCDQKFGELRLYPFVRRFNSVDAPNYQRSVDESLAVTVQTPQLVPAACWNYICYKPSFASQQYLPSPNPHINEWHKHNPPPGTAYNPGPRLDHPSLTGGPGGEERITRLHEMAPFDMDISYYISRVRYNKAPTYDQAEALYREVLPYSARAMNQVAHTLVDQPDRFEKLMAESSRICPVGYFTLAEYFKERQQEEKAAGYFEKAFENSTDSVRNANGSDWLVKYYLKRGEIDKARKLADEAGETWSYRGLETKASFLEETKVYREAFQFYSRIAERYEDNGPLISFCLRYKATTGDTRYDASLKKLTSGLFPKGLEQVELKSVGGAPVDGVLVEEENDLVRQAGLKVGNVIVAVFGIRVHSFPQYVAARDFNSNPEMVWIVWQGKEYREIKFRLPGHKFGVNFGTFKPK